MDNFTFEELIKKAGVNLPTDRIMTWFNLLDQTNAGSISPSQFTAIVEDYSIKHSDVNSTHILYSVMQKIRSAIHKSNYALHCVLRPKCTEEDFELSINTNELREAFEEIAVGLAEAEYTTLFDFLDPAETEIISYERFFELLGYIQPIIELGNKEEVKNVSELIIPLFNALRDYCEPNNISLETALKMNKVEG